MEVENFCQSCSMPLEDPEMHGTEADGTKSPEYCKYCYQNGAFIDPEMSLKKMTSIVIEQMEKRHIGPQAIDRALTALPHLKRWRTSPAL